MKFFDFISTNLKVESHQYHKFLLVEDVKNVTPTTTYTN